MNTREKQLMIGLLVLLLGGIAYLGFDQLNNWKKRLDVEARRLEIAKAEANDMLSKEKLWQERATWLAASEPAFGNRKDSELALINLIKETAGTQNVALPKIQPTEPLDLEDMIAATVIVDAKADLDKMMEWLHDLQKPPSFLSVPTLRLMPDQEDTSKVLMSINVQKWFRKVSS